jgi:ArsR family transcriptional regulator
MAQNKKADFSDIDQQMANFAKALSHPARVAIIKILAAQSSCICGEIVKVLPLAQSTVSQHLKELQLAGLVKGTIDGTKSCYCINWENMERCIKRFNELLIPINNRDQFNCC